MESYDVQDEKKNFAHLFGSTKNSYDDKKFLKL